MRNSRGLKMAGLFTLALAGVTCLAQNAEAPKESPKFYRLEFVVKELEAGKVINARAYSMTASTNGESSETRTNSRVQLPTGQVGVGVTIECRALKELGNELSLFIKAEISSIVQEPGTSSAGSPIIRQNVWGSAAVVPIKKPSVVFKADDTATKQQMQLELTATPIE